jgi:acyl-CoA reductase-like NAD-dependent aldehyde dehydrogenase
MHPMYINGAWREGSEGGVAEDLNPATGEVFARVAQAGARDVEDALAAAHGARDAWRRMLVNEREALLLKTADIIASRANEIRDLLIEETGSVFMKAPWEVSYAVECLRAAAACLRQPHGNTFPASAPGQMGMTIRQPLTTISDEPHIDFGGVKASGFGREGGMASMAEMTEVKWITFQMGKREFPF